MNEFINDYFILEPPKDNYSHCNYYKGVSTKEGATHKFVAKNRKKEKVAKRQRKINRKK